MKIVKQYGLLLIAILSLVILASCGVDGDPNRSEKPIVEITSFDGNDEITAVEYDDASLFQQQIFWDAFDNDGVVEKFAFRVGLKRTNGKIEYLRTAGFDDIISVTGDYETVDQFDEPASMDESDDNGYGWIYHHSDGVDSSIPLQNLDNSKKTIWTSSKYAVVNFPSNVVRDTTTTGEYTYTKLDDTIDSHFFEIKAIDNRGTVSDIVRRYYSVYSDPQEISVQSTKGAFDKVDGEFKEIGQGLTFQFGLLNNIKYVGRIPWYYKFRFKKISNNSDYSVEDETEWLDTRFLNDDNDVSLVTLYTDQISGVSEDRRKIYLNSKDADGVPENFTVIEAIGYDVSGVETASVADTIFVSDKFKPQALMYLKHSYAIGKNHFSPLAVTSDGDLPTMSTEYGINYGLQFYTNKDGDYTAMYDTRFKAQMRWGYNGEFKSNSPNEKRNGVVLDAETNENYLSEITYYDLRLNDDFYFYYPLVNASDADHIIEETDADGVTKKWLRVPTGTTIAQKTLISSDLLKYIPHDVEITEENKEQYANNFELRVVDLQGVPSDVYDFEFYLYEPKENIDKSGAILIDDYADVLGATELDNYYDKYIADLETEFGKFDVIDLEDLESNLVVSKLSPTDLNKYKLIILASDLATSSLTTEYLPILTNLRLGSNFFMSTSNAYKQAYFELRNSGNSFMTYFGINHSDDNLVSTMGQNYFLKPYMIGAQGSEGFNDLVLNTETSPYLQINTLINGYGPLSFFNNDIDGSTLLYDSANVIATMNIKDVDENDFYAPQTSEEYDQYNEKIIGIENVIENNSGTQKVYLLTAPLSFMTEDSATSFLRTIWEKIQ